MKLPRLWGWYIAATVMLFVCWQVAPKNFGVLEYAAAKLCLAAIVAYIIDHNYFSQTAHPRIDANMPRDNATAARYIARALIFVGAAIVFGTTL